MQVSVGGQQTRLRSLSYGVAGPARLRRVNFDYAAASPANGAADKQQNAKIFKCGLGLE